jgi:hypothetical protein
MNLFALDLLHIVDYMDYKNINDSNFVMYIGLDSSFKGPNFGRYRPTGLFSRRDTRMNLFALDLLHIGDYKNTDDSNFALYIGSDSSFKGPDIL